jgi:hypothetical protein
MNLKEYFKERLTEALNDRAPKSVNPNEASPKQRIKQSEAIAAANDTPAARRLKNKQQS